jgi:putative toxin-antitoxin system antitoxin component (TIGR02293 family)
MCGFDHGTRLSRIQNAAREMMCGDGKAADQWLNTPCAIFEQKTPIEHAASEAGIRDVLDLIDRLRHGIFS